MVFLSVLGALGTVVGGSRGFEGLEGSWSISRILRIEFLIPSGLCDRTSFHIDAGEHTRRNLF